MEKEINLNEILRKMGMISCDVLSKKTNDTAIISKLKDLKQRLARASGTEIRSISFEIQEIKAAQRGF